jgi:hypothetical protein
MSNPTDIIIFDRYMYRIVLLDSDHFGYWFINTLRCTQSGTVWFTKCNVKGNNNGLHSITVGNKFE